MVETDLQLGLLQSHMLIQGRWSRSSRLGDCRTNILILGAAPHWPDQLSNASARSVIVVQLIIIASNDFVTVQTSWRFLIMAIKQHQNVQTQTLCQGQF